MRRLRSRWAALALALAAAPLLPGYDNSSASELVLPEVVWAPAAGGGAWTTGVQITARDRGTVVEARFYPAQGTVRVVPNLFSIPANQEWRSVTFPNVLKTLQARDPGFSYYGKVGALWLRTQDAAHRIWASARTVNGRYGKTFPGLRAVESNTANYTPDESRCLVVQQLTRTAATRTVVGAFNALDSGMLVEFRILSGSDTVVGLSWHRWFAPYEYATFDPFADARAGAGTFENCLLWIHPARSDRWGPGTLGLFAYGALADNATNDPSALIAVQDR